MAKRYTLTAAQRLKSKKSIDALFSSGQRLNVGCLRILHAHSSTPGVHFGVGVSAKNFKRAVDRNRIKRQLRESYRLQKEVLATLATQPKGIDLFVLYTDKELPEYQHLFSQLQKGLQKLLSFYQVK
ncbi:MAG: ribonuclease P protein component [Sphingomonadales bacterium]